MSSKPKTFVEALARMIDSGWGADPEDPVVIEIVDVLKERVEQLEALLKSRTTCVGGY